MAATPKELRAAAEKVHGPGQTRAVKLRTFLSWFGAKRRGVQVVSDIRRALKRVNLVTEPDFMTLNIEDRVRLKPLNKPPITQKLTAKPLPNPRQVADTAPEVIETPAVVAVEPVSDPTPRLGTIFGGSVPVNAKPEDTVRSAITKMVNRDFSQLPVMSNSRTVVGMITWKSIGEAFNLHNRQCEKVRECMEKDVRVLPADTPLWKAIRTIAEHDVVLVQAANGEIDGLVTTYDLAHRYYTMAEPFLLLGEIEANIRQLITLANYPLKVLTDAKNPKDVGRTVASVSDLTFGECVRILERPDNWRSVTKGLSRSTFIKELEAVRQIRNEVMHFSPDPLSDAQLKTLRDAAQMMRKLKLFES